MKQTRLANSFIEFIPDELSEGVLYVSMTHSTATHKCACGCGREVVTPLSPTDWQLWFDGENVSLEPSIGNWNFPCRSHYHVRGGAIRWAGDMSHADIEKGRARDRSAKAKHYASRATVSGEIADPTLTTAYEQTEIPPAAMPRWKSLLTRLFGS